MSRSDLATGQDDRGSRRVRLVLELESGEPVVGCVRSSEGDDREFTGWLDLLVALEAALTVASTPVSDASERAIRPS